MSNAELDDIRAFVADLTLPADATQTECLLYQAVKNETTKLLAEVDRLRGLLSRVPVAQPAGAR